MLYFFYGTDTDNARAKARAIIDDMRKKKPDAEVFRIDAENWSAARLEEYIGGRGLFEQRLIVLANRLFENLEARESVLKRLEAIQQSENIFIFLEGEVEAKTLREIKKGAERVQEFEQSVSAQDLARQGKFNVFQLADAFGRRDRKGLWILFQKALQYGAVPEEIHGVLFWQLKSILLAASASSFKEAGLAPFVFTKVKSSFRNYTADELQHLSEKLVAIYHDSHRGLCDFEIALERFILGI